MSVSKLIRAATNGKTLPVLTFRALQQLADERGSERRAFRWLQRQATRAQTPIGINFPAEGDPNGASTTVFVPPTGWSEDRLRGWIGARHEELGAVFGETDRMYKLGDPATIGRTPQ